MSSRVFMRTAHSHAERFTSSPEPMIRFHRVDKNSVDVPVGSLRFFDAFRSRSTSRAWRQGPFSLPSS